MPQQEIIKRMRNRIMEHQKENGFETIFDFLNEDLLELAQTEVNKLALGDVGISLKINWEEVYEQANHCDRDSFDEYIKSIFNER